MVPRRWGVRARNRRGLRSHHRCVELQSVERVRQEFGRAGEVLQQLRVLAEADDEGEILGLEHAREELPGRGLFNADQAFLATADVDQQSDGSERQISTPRVKALIVLLRAVFEDREFLFGEIGNESALLRSGSLNKMLTRPTSTLITFGSSSIFAGRRQGLLPPAPSSARPRLRPGGRRRNSSISVKTKVFLMLIWPSRT